MKNLASLDDRYQAYKAAGEFVTIARTLCMARGDALLASKMSEAAKAGPRVIEGIKGIQAAIQHRSAVAAGSTTDANYGPLVNYTQAADAYVLALRGSSCFQRMVGDMRPFPLHTRVAVETSGANGDTVFEAGVKLINSLALESHNLLERKAVVVLVITDELLRHGGGSLFEQELTRGVAYQVDSKALSVLSTGITPTASSGSTANAVSQDIAAALNALRIGATSKVYCVTTSATMKAIAVGVSAGDTPSFPGININGGDFAGITFLACDACPAGQMIFVDCDGIAANSGTIELETIKYGDVQMDTAPDSPVGASSVLQSLWQKNQVALCVHRHYGLERLRDTAVAVLTGCHYQGDSP